MDHHGRRRKLEEGEGYKARNFYVQSPASLHCLDRLIALDTAVRGIARVAFHVHDGYVIAAKKETWREAFRLSVDALEGQSEWFPGLRLSVGCQAGRKLNEMSVLRKAKTKG